MLLFTEPVPRPALWGGTLLRDYFHYPQFPDDIGQSWSFSAQEGEGLSNRIVGMEGMTLLNLWEERPELFCSRHKRFPVIISLVAPEDDLSLQIHPNARISARLGYPTGKNEAWYFLETKCNAQIVYGQNAHDEAQLREMIATDRWDEIMRYLPVQKGDFVYLPAGVVHALKKGSIVYEIQQATDITYRFFDYHRVDAQGHERPLQLEEAIGCVDYTLTQSGAKRPGITHTFPHASVTTFVANDSFCVRRYEVFGTETFHFAGYQLMTCVAGKGTADGQDLSVGKSVLITAGSETTFTGQMTLMCTCEQ